MLRPRRPRSRRYPDQKILSLSSAEDIAEERRPNAEDLRRMRAEYYTAAPGDRQFNMANTSAPRRSTSACMPSTRSFECTPPPVQLDRSAGHGHRRRRTRTEEQNGESDHVYVYRTKPTAPEPPRLQRSKTTTTVSAARTKDMRQTDDALARSHTDRRKSRHKEDDIAVKRTVRLHHRPESESPKKSYRSRPPLTRTASTRDTASIAPSRPSLLRSQTTSRRVRPPPPSNAPFSPSVNEPPPSVVSRSRRSSGFFGSILGTPKEPPAPEKRVECLTCLSSYPASRTARLACNHRMCHACLRRIFNLSITDPQHMPPKCCTAEHIPLKHVDKLFDLKFKMKWNQKYQEYTTKNRLYCPARGCGEWIKPANIHVDTTGGANTGRKYGKCGRCRTRVCVACNGRWHSSRTCPKDDATKQFIEIAKKEGWQRCYNCSATVELKEGCNHMTCRCKAEFCMICGVQWKGCDCPWFNYQTVEQDRLNHMNVPMPNVIRRVVVVDGQEVDADHPRAARGYQAELDARREQERRDEQLARRLQTLGLDPPGVEIYQVMDDDHDHGFGIGNSAVHHVNTHFVPPRPPPPPPQPAVMTMPSIPYNNNNARQAAQPTYPSVPRLQPQPVLRQHSQASRAYNHHQTTRPAERVVPRRSATGYEHEATVHAPLGSATVGLRVEEPSGSALAGLTRGGTAEGRVDEWRRWVEVGNLTITSTNHYTLPLVTIDIIEMIDEIKYDAVTTYKHRSLTRLT
ncbi:MAG: hypothetical protein Q9169_004338 [Polycauliona sp. 2 TL-2023]